MLVLSGLGSNPLRCDDAKAPQSSLAFHLVADASSTTTIERSFEGSIIHLITPAVLTDPKIESAELIFLPEGFGIDIELGEPGKSEFGKLTNTSKGKSFAIVSGERVLFVPKINDLILDGKFTIEAGLTLEDAKDFISVILESRGAN